MAFVITEPCIDVKDLSCIEKCPVDCIYIGEGMAYIHPDECVDCGACVRVCPVEAIFYEDDVPEQWQPYIQANVDFFLDLGSPGGASRVDVSSLDAPLLLARRGRLIEAPAPNPKTSVDLWAPSRRQALRMSGWDSDDAEATAFRILFGTALGMAEESETEKKIELDEYLFPLNDASFSEAARILADEGGAGRHSAAQSAELSAVRRRTLIECVGKPAKEVTHIFDMAALGKLASLLPLLVQSTARLRGHELRLVSERFGWATFAAAVLSGGGAGGQTAFDAEIVLPDLSQAPAELVTQFAVAHERRIVAHIDLMAELTDQNLEIEDMGNRLRHWREARDLIADSGADLWQLARTAVPGTRGDVALGIVSGRPTAAWERVFAQTGASSPQSSQVYYLTKLGSTRWW